MSSLTIEEPHSLSAAEARARVDRTLSGLAAKYGGSFEWQSESEARLKHSMATATVRIEPQRVLVQVEGGMALSLVKGKVDARVRRELQSALG